MLGESLTEMDADPRLHVSVSQRMTATFLDVLQFANIPG
jgi:hypothetical protein